VAIVEQTGASLEGGQDVTEPNFAVSSPNGTDATQAVAQLKQVSKLARLTCGSLPTIAALLLFVTWVMSTDGGFVWTTPGAIRPVLMLILAVGLAVAASSSFVAGFMGRRAAQKWVAAGRRVDDVVFEAPATGMGLGLGATPAVPQTLWMKFFTASVVGCALPEALLLAAFVVTIASRSGAYLLVATAVYLPLWALNFPRRAIWDSWAFSAGLTLPWDGSGVGTLAQAPPPTDVLAPR